MKHSSFKFKRLRLTYAQIIQVSRWKKAKVRQMFKSNNSYYRIVAHNPNARKVKSVTDAYNLHEETISSIHENETVMQTSHLEVIVSRNQHTVTFNDVPILTGEPESNNRLINNQKKTSEHCNKNCKQ